jgi:hypothetical protein
MLRFFGGQRRRVDDELAVLGPCPRTAFEHVTQGGDVELGLDDRPGRVVDERLAVIEERLRVTLQESPDRDDARAGLDVEAGRRPRPRGDHARLQHLRRDALVAQQLVELAEAERRRRES